MDHIYYQVSFKWDVDYLVEGCDKEKAFKELLSQVDGTVFLKEGLRKEHAWSNHLEVVFNIDRNNTNSVFAYGYHNEGYVYQVISVDSEKVVYKCYLPRNDAFLAFKKRHGLNWESELVENIKFNVIHSSEKIMTYSDVEAVARMRVTDVEVKKCER